MFMKIKSLVLAAALSPAMLALGQTQKAVFYNQGKMSVVGTDPNATVLYIQGDFVAGDNSAKTVTSDVLMTKSRVVLTGDFIHNALATGAKVFNSASSSDAVFEFRGTAKQQITSDGTTFSTIPNKGTSYIDFPTLQINNSKKVVLDAALAAQTANLNLTKGTLVLDATRIDASNVSKYMNKDLPTSTKNPDERSALAHLKVSGAVNYNDNMLAADSADRSFVRVIVPFDKDGYSTTNGRYASIVGMGIPFQGMHTDYFMWNYVMQPTNDNYFGPGNMPLNDKSIVLVPGRGYIIGNNLKGNTFADYEPNNTSQSWGPGSNAQFDSRFNTEYVFDRAAFAARSNTNNRMGAYANGGVAYTEEKLNTGDVEVQLTVGYNYLANPFTSPLDISDIINGTAESTWKVKASSVKDGRDIRNRVWVMNGTSRGSAKDNMLNPNQPMPNNELQLEVNVDLAKQTGSTYIDENGGARVLIPALQLFIVYAEKPVKITIPKSAQSMGINTFIRSTNTEFDDFVFEVYDATTKTSDRTSVVLRPKSELISNTEYTNVNKMNPVIERSTASTNNSKLLQGVSSQLYTKSDTSDDPLMVKYLGYTPNVDAKVSTPLYLKPSNYNQEVVIKGYRLESLTNFETVTLVDKLLGKEVVLTPETEYRTTVKSTDSDDRFSLIFSRGTDGIEDEIENETKSISSYYANGTLTVTGFEESDFGSVLTVYDLQGRQVAQTKVADFTVNVTANFAPGAFVVKVVGNNSYVAKFLVK